MEILSQYGHSSIVSILVENVIIVGTTMDVIVITSVITICGQDVNSTNVSETTSLNDFEGSHLSLKNPCETNQLVCSFIYQASA